MTPREPTPEELRARVLSAAAAVPSAPRPVVARRSLALMLVAIAIAIAVFELRGGVRPSGRPDSLMLKTVVTTGLIALAAAWASLGRGRSTLGRPWTLAVPVAFAAGPAILAFKFFISEQYAGGVEEWPTRPGFKCLALGLSIAICPLVAFLVSRRLSHVQRPAINGLVAGLAIGALSNVLTDLWCPVAFLPHLLLGHLLPMLLLGGVGALIGWLLDQARTPGAGGS